MKKIVIAIDGTSSSGKSSFARRIAAKLGYVFIDTGAMYRAVTLYAMRRGCIAADGAIDTACLIAGLSSITIEFRPNPVSGNSDIYLNGENVEQPIRTIEVSERVSAVSQIPAVREQLVELQRLIGTEKGVVMDGRDIGTVVFPDAELKLFMTADPEVRAMRRYRELTERGEKVSLEEIVENIRKRDQADMTRAVSPLKKAPDALTLDNSRMSQEEQMVWVMEKINKLTQGNS
jgi:cytidylate kinase